MGTFLLWFQGGTLMWFNMASIETVPPTQHVAADASVLDVWSANRKRALSSALFRRVEVPLALE